MMLVEDMHAGRKGVSATGEMRDIPRPFRCRVQFTDESVDVSPGDIIRFNAILEPVDRYTEVDFMRSDGLYNTATGVLAGAVVRPEEVNVIGKSDKLVFKFRRCRDRLATAIYASKLSPQSASLLAAACLGTGDAQIEVKERFRLAGLSHLLCVSGFHVAVVAWLISLVLLPMRLWRRAGRWRYAVLIACVWLYVCLTGLIPSAQRAALMITAFYIVRLLQRKPSSFNTLSLAVGIMLIADPLCLYAVGFQLSVSAVAGILVFADALNPIRQRYHTLYQCVSLFTTPLAAMLGSAPVVLAWFHRLPFLALPANALASLIFPVFMICGGLAVLTGFSPAIWLTEELRKMIMIFSESGSSDSMALSGVFLSSPAIALLCAGIIFFALSLHTKSWRMYYGAACCVAMLAFAECTRINAKSPEILIHGNAFGSEICLAEDNKVEIHACSSRTKALGGASAYFEGRGCDTPDFMGYRPEISFHGIDIAVARNHTDTLPQAPYLVIDASYKGDIQDLLAMTKPETVIIGANTAPGRAAEIRAASAGRKLHSLFYKALVIKASE